MIFSSAVLHVQFCYAVIMSISIICLSLPTSTSVGYFLHLQKISHATGKSKGVFHTTTLTTLTTIYLQSKAFLKATVDVGYFHIATPPSF